jgi:DNA-binding MarR family transcriptional regulator
MDALRRIVRDLRLSAREAERSAGISGAQLFVLEALAGGAASSLNELAERTCTDQSSVSVVVSRLVDRGLVARTPSEHDARRVELSLTRAGQRLLARCPQPTQARLVAAVRKLDNGELAALRDGLESIVDAIGASGEAARMFFDEEVAPKRRARR